MNFVVINSDFALIILNFTVINSDFALIILNFAVINSNFSCDIRISFGIYFRFVHIRSALKMLVRNYLSERGYFLINLPKSFSGSKCLLLGFGKSNRALAKWLIKNGANVTVADKKKSEAVIISETEKDGCGGIKLFNSTNKNKFDFVFRTPGISPFRREVTEAVDSGAILSSETELFFERARGKIYGITGSDGKTTTTTITGKILEKAFENSKKRVFVGGNIGTPLISFLDLLTENDVTVAELSSFQLMTMCTSPYIAAITNITENHLDYHRNMTEYVSAKRRIYSGKGCCELVTDTQTLSLLKNKYLSVEKHSLPSKITEISPSGDNTDIYFKDGGIYLYGKRILDGNIIKIPGFHNIQNYMTAIGITKNDAAFSDIKSVFETFSGAEHRMEFVRNIGGVSFYNSSIDSTPSRSVITLKCFEKPLTVICGGYDKHLDYGEFAYELLKRADNVVVTGASADVIKKAIEKQCAYGQSCNVYYENDFEKAVRIAAELTKDGGKVLLSPASASFDAFENFEQRGRLFKKIANSL